MTRVTSGSPEPADRGLIHEAVARQARRHPERIALRQGDAEVTYRELHLASDELTVDLHAAGVGPGALVPVLIPRSPRLVATLLAILKCGAGYAVLDPSWPEERLRSIIGRLAPPVLLAQSPVDLGVLCWTGADAPIGELARRGRPAPELPCASGSAATVFFTSGSTGTPKGVVAPHRAVLRLFGPGTFADLGPGRTMMAAGTPYWDVMALEVWGPLVSGGTVALVEDEYLMPAGLAELVRDRGVDTAWLTTSLFNMFVDEDLSCFEGIGQLLIGGERVSQHHVRKFLTRHPGIRLTNGYGPAEACVFTTTHPITLEDTEHPNGVPIGRPVPQTGVHLLDGDALCGPGETGEVCISGAGLANEYLGQPEETRARFTTVELDGVPTRVYRTGDLGFEGPDGLLYYRGRTDRQVKIRGYRIEPLEIENACLALPSVERAVAVPVPDEDGALSRMALFYVHGAGTEPLAEETVRARLAESLPAHCMPAEFRELAAIPLTPNGKADSHALLETLTRAPASADAATAVGGHQDIARGEYARIVGPEADPDASFAALGGTSLDALRLCARTSDRIGRRISAGDFLRTPTLAGLLALVESAAAVSASSTAEETGPIPLSGVQANFCLQHELLPDDPSAVCQVAWRVSGPLRLPVLEAALNDLHRRHEGLRAVYRVDDAPVTVLPGPVDAIRVETVAEERFDEALGRPLRIEKGEVWRCVVTETGLLGLAVHHVSFDGWSQGILVAELAQAYVARLRGATPRFAAEPPGLRRLAEEEAALHGPDGYPEQLRYWSSALAGLPELDFPQPAGAPAAREAAQPVVFTVGPERVGALSALAQRSGATLFAPLVACYGAALTRVLGQRDFGIGVALARRFGNEAARAVSCLVDALCLRLPALDGCRTPEDALAAALPVVTAGLARQDLRFADVVREVRPPRTGRNPLYQTLFAYQGNEEPRLELPECTVRPYTPAAVPAMNELVCEVWPLPDGGLRVDLTHQGHRVGRNVVERVARAYQELLVGDRSGL
ncbi:amino acid adenylation domain-containing protein [Streptomyces sp. TRM76323]|uniref:Amino acid adenylation domain-containing protein n=1 Tax=Streptomyces tamarix TaxID=3078565 RepID=A0ABU3QQI3_9ACTN|nr:amino acid adenylation domain-containing protein [Streptomyces tamarix]MDT9685019.1 amino acid adenylation domain-containing protein [Streptomyces tamarix]